MEACQELDAQQTQGVWLGNAHCPMSQTHSIGITCSPADLTFSMHHARHCFN